MSQDRISQASQPTSEPQNHAKATQGKLGVVAHTCNPSQYSGEQEQQLEVSWATSYSTEHSPSPKQTLQCWLLMFVMWDLGLAVRLHLDSFLSWSLKIS